MWLMALQWGQKLVETARDLGGMDEMALLVVATLLAPVASRLVLPSLFTVMGRELDLHRAELESRSRG